MCLYRDAVHFKIHNVIQCKSIKIYFSVIFLFIEHNARALDTFSKSSTFEKLQLVFAGIPI